MNRKDFRPNDEYSSTSSKQKFKEMNKREQPKAVRENPNKRYSVSDRIKHQYSSKVEQVSSQPDGLMDSNMTHYKITLKNNETGRQATYYYSEGSGRNSDTDDERVASLVSSLQLDRTTDVNDIYGEEDVRKKIKIENAIAKNNLKNDRIGFDNFYNSLSDKQKQNLDEGYFDKQ